MISQHLQHQILNELGHSPTPSQSVLCEALAGFISDPGDADLFILKGYAGTGKTTFISAAINVLKKLKISSVLLAPTGRAAKVLSNYSGHPAYTVHKKIYRQKSTTDGFGEFVLNKNLLKDTFFFIDEASMISDSSYESSVFGSGKLLDDLVEFVYNGNNCRMVLIGDTAQLPPVGFEISPALDPEAMKRYLLKIREATLTDIIRQASESGILLNATMLRNKITNADFTIPKIVLKNFPDIINLRGAQFSSELESCYDKDGLENTLVITRSNKTANKYNEGIRRTLLWKEDEVATGDQLMIVRNNYFWLPENETQDFIANGDIAEITRINKYEDLYGFRFADVDLRLRDYDEELYAVKILLNTLTSEAPALPHDDNKKLFYAIAEDYQNIKNKQKRFKEMRENPYLNALQVKFAYAVTCHKAQGGQWKNVFIDQGYITEERIDMDYLRWLYTGITRSQEKVYLVNFRDEFYSETDRIDF